MRIKDTFVVRGKVQRKEFTSLLPAIRYLKRELLRLGFKRHHVGFTRDRMVVVDREGNEIASIFPGGA